MLTHTHFNDDVSLQYRLTHVSLRNNRIGEEGARLIGSALATAQTANNNLLSLNLAFNSIGDAGAAHIAQVLWMRASAKLVKCKKCTPLL